MKFCYGCGYKLEGYEKFCPECGKEFKNPEDTEDLLGSIFNQVFEDVDRFKEEAIEMFNELDIEDAIDDFSKNTKKALNMDLDYIRRARKKLGNDDKRVIELCNKALAVDGKNWETYYLKGRALINLEQYNSAIDDLISALALNENNLKIRLYIARAYDLKGNWDCALKVYDSILNVNEKYFDALTGKAIIYFDHDNFIEADKYFKKANNVSYLPKDMLRKWSYCSVKLKEE